MAATPLDPALVARLHARANADGWSVTVERFGEALATSVTRAFPSGPSAAELDTYTSRLHVEDLALACACADGHEGAWEHFVREHRPGLYRAADAIDRSGGGREIADSLYAELFGLAERGGARRSLFRYFHGRSSLSTWLRAVLAQRHVDRARQRRKVEPLPPDDGSTALEAPAESVPGADRQHFLAAMSLAVSVAVGQLAARDRLRLACYYAQNLTLAQIGKMLGEHEATVSRQLARTRRAVRQGVEQQLRDRGMSEVMIAECFASVIDDAGTLDLSAMLGDAARKDPQPDRSTSRWGRR